jgi:hypothetical protein
MMSDYEACVVPGDVPKVEQLENPQVKPSRQSMQAKADRGFVVI